MKDKPLKLKDYPKPVEWWPELEGTISAETAKKIGIRVPKGVKRIKLEGV